MFSKIWNWFRGAKPESVNPYPGLRQLAFDHQPRELGLTPTPELPDVWGALMEFRAGAAIVSLVSMGDGTSSLYFSNGGGIIGAGGHSEVVQATQHFLVVTQQVLNLFQATSDYPPPSGGNARFYALTYSGVKTVEVAESQLRTGHDRFSELYAAAHEVIAWIRMTSDRQPAE